MNWALMANLTWDYGQDTIGYTLGAVAELNQKNWTLRYGYFEMPAYINAGDVGSGNSGEDEFLAWPARGHFAPIFKSYAMATELEERYTLGPHPGVLAWLNHADIDTYQDATRILLASGPNADLTPAQAYHYAYGVGLNWEQELTSTIGVFSRLGLNDGKTQALEFSDANWSASLGLSIKGGSWHRPNDTVGIGGAISGLSKNNQAYLNAGGVGIELGDGALNYNPERALETYYRFEWLQGVDTTLDYQLFSNPGANQARGPVSVFGVRLHFEL
jgi:high affinity Mn2+ porin